MRSLKRYDISLVFGVNKLQSVLTLDSVNNMNTNPTKEVTMSVTYTTYEAAQQALKEYKRKGRTTIASWVIGGGWTAEAYFCPRRNRIITASVNAEGFKVF